MREAEPEPEPEMVSLGSRRGAEPAELTLPPLPVDLLTGSSVPFGTPPASPVASARGPHGPGDADGFRNDPGDLPGSDPFGLNRAAGRGPGQGRGDRGNRPPARSRHGDSDHSAPSDHEREPGQDVESQGPEAETPGRETSFGGFRLGGTGRFLFSGRAPDAHPGVNGHAAEADTSAAVETGVAGHGDVQVIEPGDAQVAEPPADEESTGATPGDEPADATSPEAGQDPAEEAGPRDENGREDMNGRAGAPGYAQPGDVPGQEEAPVADSPAEENAPVSGWASVPVQPPTSGGPAGPVSGAPVSPGYAPAPYLATDFTPDHPAVTLDHPAATLDHQAAMPDLPEPVADPAASAAPVSPAQPLAQALPAPTPPAPISGSAPAPVSGSAPVTGSAPVSGSAAVPAPDLAYPMPPIPQIPATRAPSDLPAAPDTGFAFGSPATTGYSLGRSGEAFGVASVTPAGPTAPQAGSVTPPPLEFQPYPESGLAGVSISNLRRGPLDEEPRPAARRSASLEDAEPVRRRAAADDDLSAEPAAEGSVIRPTVWDEDAARHFRAAWHEVKAEFVDDPVNALTRAHDLLTDAVNELTEVLLAERDDLDPLRGTDTPDTESMRMAMRGYREFLDRILSL
ncbi:hypothetical protein [Actinoplanes sp. NPDC020271]|uniref:hypothetical protein n=1 Tax=Actinoplanes sp. NPDC020271 TaxID=3363896 RepID=UPI0037A28494